MQPVQPTAYVAYYRVSTQKQGADGLGIEAQRAAVKAFAGASTIHAEFTEVESGGKNNRPELAKALAVAKASKAVLLIAKLDRLSRNSALVNNLLEANVEFVAVDQPHATPLTIRILAAVAQEEREQISKRVKAALAIAKSRGVKLGGSHPAKQAAAISFAQRIHKDIQTLMDAGITEPAALAKALNERAVRTSRGSTWGPGQVVRVLRRLSQHETC